MVPGARGRGRKRRHSGGRSQTSARRSLEDEETAERESGEISAGSTGVARDSEVEATGRTTQPELGEPMVRVEARVLSDRIPGAAIVPAPTEVQRTAAARAILFAEELAYARQSAALGGDAASVLEAPYSLHESVRPPQGGSWGLRVWVFCMCSIIAAAVVVAVRDWSKPAPVRRVDGDQGRSSASGSSADFRAPSVDPVVARAALGAAAGTPTGKLVEARPGVPTGKNVAPSIPQAAPPTFVGKSLPTLGPGTNTNPKTTASVKPGASVAPPSAAIPLKPANAQAVGSPAAAALQRHLATKAGEAPELAPAAAPKLAAPAPTVARPVPKAHAAAPSATAPVQAVPSAPEPVPSPQAAAAPEPKPFADEPPRAAADEPTAVPPNPYDTP